MIYKKEIPIYIFKFLWILTLLNNIIYPFNISILNRLIGYMSVMCTFIFVITCILNELKIKYKDLFFVISIFIIILISHMISSINNIDSVYLLGVLGFLSSILLIITQKYIDIDKEMVKFIFNINFTMSIVYIIYSILPFAYNYDGGTISSLTLGYANPNSTGIILLFNFILLNIHFSLKNKRNVILIIFNIYILYLIYLTNSRTCLLVAILFILLTIRNTLKPIKKTNVILFTIVPVLYVYLLKIIEEMSILKDIKILGKSIFTGRENLFIEKLHSLDGTLQVIFGNIGTNKFANAHNGPLAIIISIGILGGIVYYIFLISNILKYNKHIGSITSKKVIKFILLIFIYSSTEAAMMTGGVPFSLMLSTLFFLCRIDFDVLN